MKRLLFLLVISLAAQAQAQDTAAPTTGETVGPARGENAGDYNIVQSWEPGYRYSLIGGDEGKYRSDVNFGNGVRLLSSYLTVNSRDGHGAYFDEIVLTTQGLGNDPYESATLRIQKNSLYRYDMMWRLNDYYNPGLATAAGLHLEDTSQRWQDHDLTLFPQSRFRFHAGYSRNKEDGPALSTINLFDSERGDIFTLFSNVRREYNSYRVGADVNLFGIRLSFLRRWEFYKEDTPYSLDGSLPGIGPAGLLNDPTTLTAFNRSEPIRGYTPSWLVTLLTERKLFAANGRFTYSGGNSNFVMNESAVGTGFTGTENRLIITYGNAKRPTATGDLNVTFFPAERLTMTNNTSVDDSRISGNSFYEQIDLATLSAQILNFQFLGIRLITNSTDVHFRATKKLDFFTGFRYVNREIRSIQSVTAPFTPFSSTPYSETDQVYAGAAGVNWLIAAPLRLHVEVEVGRNDNPFTPIDEKNYHAIDSGLQYRRRSITASAGYRQMYNNNSVTLTSFSSHSRDYFGNFSWTARDWFDVDLGYSRIHLDTAGGIAFFEGSPRAVLETGESIYISNIHAANLGTRIALRKRADLYLGYNITRDTGATFPLSFATPLARLTIPLTPKIKWNAGYQYYGYHEFVAVAPIPENYHAHTGYTSLLFSF